jgi:hypothetical protein
VDGHLHLQRSGVTTSTFGMHINTYIYIYVCRTCACAEMTPTLTSRGGAACTYSKGWDDHIRPTRGGLTGTGMTIPTLQNGDGGSPHPPFMHITYNYIYIYIGGEREGCISYIYYIYTHTFPHVCKIPLSLSVYIYMCIYIYTKVCGKVESGTHLWFLGR